MRQSYTINATSAVIYNTEKRRPKLKRRRSARVDADRDVLERIPEVVELGGNGHLPASSSLGEGADLSDGPLPQIADDISQSHIHPDSSTSTSAVSPRGMAFTQPRLEDRDAPTQGASAAASAPPAGAAAPRLFYEDRLVTLYQGDCLVSPELWTIGDVLITDPPYGLQALAGAYGFRSTKRGSVTIANDLDTTVRDRVLELWGDKPAAVFGTPRLPEPPGGWTDRLVWDKQQLGLNGGPWRYAHESIFVRGSGWRRISDASSSILRHSSAANRAHVAKHIHSKPEKVIAELIAAAPEGVLVDTFAGGGSTVAAARALGRRIIAFELEEKYCAEIVDRVTSRIDLGEGDS